MDQNVFHIRETPVFRKDRYIMNFWNTVRKIAKIRFYASFLLVGILFVVASCFVIAQPKPDLLSVEGTIEKIEVTLVGSEEEYQVFVSYRDQNGGRHLNIPYPSYSSSMKEGDTVTVLYAPAAPEEIQAPGGAFIPYLILVIGVAAIVFSVWSILADAKKVESNSPFENSAKTPDPLLVEQIRSDDSPKKEYYFHWTGKLNQSYILETPERQAIYEAICDHIGVFTPYRYTFANRVTGGTQEHKISHTVTKRYGNGSDSGLSFSVVSASQFKIDDVNNWDYLANLGYSIEPKRSGIKLNFDVLHYGVPVACLEAAGVNILKDDKQTFLGDKLPATGLFKVSCKDSDLEGVFWACFCASRVEFY